MDWNLYPNFTRDEMACRFTGRCEMHPDFMARLQRLRVKYGRPIYITSGYRDPTHPLERSKGDEPPGAHTLGRAADIAVRGGDALRLVGLAIAEGFTGVGVSQRGNDRFIHIDDCEPGALPRPMIWSY